LKIRLDENLSYRVANAVKAIVADRDGFQVTHNTIVAQGVKDPHWLKKFASEDGDVIVSGDWNILQNWPDLVAYTESGLISFFPPSGFGKLFGPGRASFIIRWWPAIIEKAKCSERGDRWRLPMAWTPDITKIEAIIDPRLKTDEQKKGVGIEPSAKVHYIRPQS
jgi:PIN like domain